MFKAVILLVLVGVCVGQFGRNRFQFQPRRQTRPQFQPVARIPVRPFVRLLRSNSEGPFDDGSYRFDFASEDGIERSEQGRLKAPDTFEIRGSYSYRAPDGTPVTVTYIADEFGYRAESPNLPVGPPIPPHAQEQIRRAEQERARTGQGFRRG